MNEDNVNTIDAISQIKGKLTKYSQRKPDPEKVNEYLNMLSNYTVNAAICKSTDIYKFVKDLKKKENPSYSQNAADLMLKWKKELTTNSVNAIDTTNDSNCKYEPTPINTSEALKQTSEKPYNATAKTKPSDSSSSFKSSSKKRLSETTKPSTSSSQEKKPKLSLNDYKSKKTITITAQATEFDMFDTKSNHSENSNDSTNQASSSTGGGSCKYGFDDMSSDDENSTEKYSPTLIAPTTSPFKKSSRKDKPNDKNMIQPPKPSTSLKDILENKPEPYVPTIVSKAAPVVNLPRSATSVRSSAATPHVPSVQRTNSMSQESVDEALSRIMKQKQGKRVLYTGKKSDHVKVPVVSSLYNICARNLVDSLDTLPSKISVYNMTHDFAIAFELLKPVLEKANAKQLENIENYSPHLLTDTDYIWKRISEQEFKKIEAPDEDESWREHYFKKYDAREQQFLRARSIVSKMQKDKPQERVTKMATLKPTMKVISHFPKAYQSPVNTVRKQNGNGYTKSAPSNITIKEAKPTPGYMRAPPVMSRGMRETIKMLKVRRK